MRTSALFDAKFFGFSEIYVVSAQTKGEGLSQCGHVTDKGESIFVILCRSLLWAAPYTFTPTSKQKITLRKVANVMKATFFAMVFVPYVLSVGYFSRKVKTNLCSIRERPCRTSEQNWEKLTFLSVLAQPSLSVWTHHKF